MSFIYLRAQERLNSARGSTDSVCDVVKDAADREASLELIQLDISRTFPHLCIFQKVVIIFMSICVVILYLASLFFIYWFLKLLGHYHI